eukprot:TRINITY_DN530_c2_g1_i1.p1 TRINITY_DN530_c2_g1~~TRINITY_DN530_c2_g1_i1.p1  ORF type:complete len:397 (-),score=118.53 TRINITY_DN530_c2_g1_i1:151-1341(-)
MAAVTGLSGTVKTYNGIKGYGFITGSALAQADILFGRDSLPEDVKEVQGKFMEGRQVMFDAAAGPDGRYKATAVAIPFQEGKQLAGQIKFFKEDKGFGFIKSSSLTEDVHFKISDLPPVLSGTELKDELVIFDVSSLPDGKLQVTKMLFQSSKIAARLRGEAPAGGKGGGKGGMGGGMGAMAGMAGGMAGMGGGMAGMGGAMGMGMQADASQNTCTGMVKSYSEKNGYGFVNMPGYGMDIKFGRNDLQVPTIAQGTQVTFSCSQDQQGRLCAHNVIPAGGAGMTGMGMQGGGMKRPAAAMGGMGGMGGMGMGMNKMQKTVVSETPTGQYAAGVIKSFNTGKGFGFISCPTCPGDVFFMKSSLPLNAQAAIQVNQAVNFEISQTSDGKIRAQNITLA